MNGPALVLAVLAATAAALVLRFEQLCLRDLARTPDEQLRLFTRPGWTVAIVAFIPLGGLLYLAAGGDGGNGGGYGAIAARAAARMTA